MTTNKIETLDQALLRPGRVDYRLLLGKAAEEQKIELYRRFFPRATTSEAREFVETYHSAETMAEFQGLLLGLEQDPPAIPNDRVFRSHSVLGRALRAWPD
jgi:mitochondrial chaperone BCS1